MIEVLIVSVPFFKKPGYLSKGLENTAAEGHNYYNLNVLRKPELDKSAWV